MRVRLYAGNLTIIMAINANGYPIVSIKNNKWNNKLQMIKVDLYQFAQVLLQVCVGFNKHIPCFASLVRANDSRRLQLIH